MRRVAVAALTSLVLAAPALFAQDTPTHRAIKKPPVVIKPWPEDDVLLARKTEAQDRTLFHDRPVLEFSLTSDFRSINAERTPERAKQFAGVLTTDGSDVAVRLSARGHLRLKSRTCEFVPIRIEFLAGQTAGTVFEGQTALKLGTHCRGDAEFDQYVLREYLAYELANIVTPLSFRARLARATYIDARSHRKLSTHNALFLENENDVARRLSGRQVKLTHMAFSEFDKDALTRMMMVEYLLGNTDFSIWALHNVVVVQDKPRKFFPVPYDFDLSGMVHPPYAAPDERLSLRSVTDRLYRGPCRTVDEFNTAAEPFRAHQADMIAAIDSVAALSAVHRREMKDYLESFFRRIATPDAIKKTFVDGCPATRGRM